MSKDDSSEFRKRFADARPLASDRAVSRPAPPTPEARFTRADERDALHESRAGQRPTRTLEEEESYLRAGLRPTVLRKLRRGRYSVRDEIDLHGLTVAHAAEILDEFLKDCERRGINCVRIVHGKGHRSGHRGPVLKPKVAKWLRRRTAVQAYCYAPVTDGGSGALYVLLKH